MCVGTIRELPVPFVGDAAPCKGNSARLDASLARKSLKIPAIWDKLLIVTYTAADAAGRTQQGAARLEDKAE